MSTAGRFANYRWMSICKPGMYIANVSMGLPGYTADQVWHIHADCVVDDFGDLQPISFTGLTAQGELLTEHVR